MSRIGKRTINIPSGASVTVNAGVASVKGPKGELTLVIDPRIKVSIEGTAVKVASADPTDREAKIMWGTTRSLLASMITGVTGGFEKKLEVVGVGYRVAADKKKITLQLGYSHPIELLIPEGLEVTVEKNTISVRGIDRQLVGQFAAIIRSQRPPEPYKGKGVKYEGEVIRRKAGKVVKAVGG